MQQAQRTPNPAIERAISVVGSQNGLASALNVSSQYVGQMRDGIRPVPDRLAIRVDMATRGEVPAEEVRPDLAEEFAYMRRSRRSRGRAKERAGTTKKTPPVRAA